MGLAGSSASITATMRCLLAFYNVSEEQVPLRDLPSLVLQIEVSELGIK